MWTGGIGLYREEREDGGSFAERPDKVKGVQGRAFLAWFIFILPDYFAKLFRGADLSCTSPPPGTPRTFCRRRCCPTSAPRSSAKPRRRTFSGTLSTACCSAPWGGARKTTETTTAIRGWTWLGPCWQGCSETYSALHHTWHLLIASIPGIYCARAPLACSVSRDRLLAPPLCFHSLPHPPHLSQPPFFPPPSSSAS